MTSNNGDLVFSDNTNMLQTNERGILNDIGANEEADDEGR